MVSLYGLEGLGFIGFGLNKKTITGGQLTGKLSPKP